MSSAGLSHPPGSLAGAARSFYDELRRMLAAVKPPLLDPLKSSVEHFNLDEGGKRRTLGYTGFLVPARLLLWRPKRTETERLSFRQRGCLRP